MQKDQPLKDGVQVRAETAPGLQSIGKSVHDVSQDDELHLVEQDQHDRGFDSVKIKYLNFDNVNVCNTHQIRVKH